LSAAEIRDLYLGGLSLHKFENNVMFHVGNITLTAPSSNLAADTWSHVAGTYDSSDNTAEIYIDGTQLNSTNAYSPTGIIYNNTFIGNDEYTGTDFDGTLDELAVFNRSLSATEIQEHYQRGVLSLNLSVRSCDDSSCSGEGFSEVLTNASGIKLNQSITPINRFFQYKFVFNTIDANYTPVLYNVTINYTTLATDSFGNYNFTFIAPSDAGSYAIKINTTFDNIPGERTVNLAVNTCFCPASGDFEILNSDTCEITTTCEVSPNAFRVLDGKMRNTINGVIRADGCFIQDAQGIFVEDGAGLYCG